MTEREDLSLNQPNHEIGEIDNVVRGLLEMWQLKKTYDPDYINFEMTELKMELNKPENERDFRRIAILETALAKFIIKG